MFVLNKMGSYINTLGFSVNNDGISDCKLWKITYEVFWETVFGWNVYGVQVHTYEAIKHE